MEILSKERFLEKKVVENFDLFDTLRHLNSTNVNDDPEERDALFSALTVVENIYRFENWAYQCDEDELKKEWVKGNLRIYVDDSKFSDPLKGFSMSAAFTHYKSDRIKYKDGCLMNHYGQQGYNPPDMWSLMALKKVRRLVMENPKDFDILKLRLTEYLIKKVCETRDVYYNPANKEALNKLMVILAEHVTKTNPSDDYPEVLTEDLLEYMRLESNNHKWPEVILKHTLTETVKPYLSGNNQHTSK